VAIVTAGGVAGGLAGPVLGSQFASAFGRTPYVGAFVTLSLVCVCLAASQMLLSADLGRDGREPTAAAPAVPFRCNIDFGKASVICAAGFAAMTLTMNAAPLSMQQCGFALPASAAVLRAHFASIVSAVAVQSAAGGADRAAWAGERRDCVRRARSAAS
jgi:hypothetical protein